MKFLFPVLVDDLSHSLALWGCFMKDLTATHCTMETAVGYLILIALHFQSWTHNTEIEPGFEYSFPSGRKKKKLNCLGHSRKLTGEVCINLLQCFKSHFSIQRFSCTSVHTLSRCSNAEEVA